ncbi:MAG: BT0820 family HAD-type phosphatase [Microbacter sp.]
MIIAVDFDGTIVEHAYPKIGREIPFAFDVLKRLQQEEYHQLILWTVREGELLTEAVDFCRSRGLEFYAVNSNHPNEDAEEEKAPRKLVADLFIDDRNLGGLPDWGVIYRMVKYGESLQEASDSANVEYQRKKKRNWLIRIGELFER